MTGLFISYQRFRQEISDKFAHQRGSLDVHYDDGGTVMIYEFYTYQMDVENHIFWVAKSKVLNGCLGQGDTLSEAIAELDINEKEWLSIAKEFNIPIPESTVRIIQKPFS